MSLLQSPLGEFRALGWRRFGVALAIAWLAPALLAAVALLLQRLLQTPMWGSGFAALWSLSLMLLLSPMTSWFALLPAAPIVAILMDRGWFGWMPAIVLGAGTGAGLGLLIGSPLLIGLGVAIFALLRAALTWVGTR